MKKLFWSFLVIHTVVWTLLPTVFRHVTAMDATEGAMWGQHLMLGYPRDPWLNAWLTRLALWISHGNDWSLYAFSQACVALAFFSVWKLGSKVLHPAYALLAVAMLEGMQYTHIAVIDFNDNVLELGLWAITVFSFYLAQKDPARFRYWVITGIFAGLGMMAKYYTAILLLSLFTFLCVDSQARRAFKHHALYVGTGVFVLMLLPHMLWLFQHNFLTIRYSHGMVALLKKPYTGLFYPWHFLLNQLATLAGAFIVLLFAWCGKKTPTIVPEVVPSKHDVRFLWCITILPLAMTLILAVINHWYLRTLWGTPLLTFAGLLCLMLIRPRLSKQRLMVFMSAVYLAMLVIGVSYAMSIVQAGKTSSANYPMRELAEEVTSEWHARYHTRLRYVVGARKVVVYISRYSPDHPMALVDYDFNVSPWVTPDALHEYGAAFVLWLKEGHETFPHAVQKKYALSDAYMISAPFAYADDEEMHWKIRFLSPETGDD